MLKEAYQPQKYGAFLIKPDSFRLGLVDFIKRDIGRAGFLTHYEQDYPQLSPKQLALIWKGNTGQEEVFKSLNQQFNEHRSQLLVVSRDDTLPIHGAITLTKGKSEKSGIRQKYQSLSRETLRRIGLEGDDLRLGIGETRVHGTGNESEFKWLLEALISPTDLDKIRVSNPELHKIVDHLLNVNVEDLHD